MWLVDEAHARASEAKLLTDLPRLDDRPVDARLFEGIAEAVAKLIKHVSTGMKVRLGTEIIGTDDEGTEAVGFGFEPLGG